MKKQTLRRIKRIIGVNVALVLSVSIIANSDVFAEPVKIFAEIFGKASASVIMPFSPLQSENDADDTTKILSESATVATKKSVSETKSASAEASAQAKTEQTKQTDTETVLAASDGEVGGRVISETIDKSGATASYGDVYVKNGTDVDINIKEQLSIPPELKIELDSKNPQVLIVHTHATESFFPTLVANYPKSWGERDNDTAKNMVSVGAVIKDSLNKSGICTVQSTYLHDLESYTGSYDRSRETIKKYMKKYPSIKVVLDVHRDAINEEDGDKIRPVISISDKAAGQIMLVSGCETGQITGYPNWKKNLRFSLGLQKTLEQNYPSLARPLFFAEKKYNQDLCPNSVLVEVGSQANLLTEAKYSAKLFALSLSEYLKNYS